MHNDNTNTEQFVTTAEFTATVARFDALNARARAKGLDGEMTITRISGLRRDNVMIGGRIVSRWGYDVQVHGRIAIDGWQPIAKGEALPDADDMVVTAFNRDDTTEYATQFAKGHCGHCNTTRRNRRHHYLLRNTNTGETMQVGRSCLTDFLGHNATATDLDYLIGGGPKKKPAPLFDLVATATGAIMVTGGYAPLGSRTPTAFIVHRHLGDLPIYAENPTADAEFKSEFAKIADTAAEQAADAITWILATTEYGYIGNLRAIAQSGVINKQHYGLAVSLAQAYVRHLETDDERQARESARATREAERAARVDASAHIGTIGEKITITGKITTIRDIENQYGTSRLLVMRTDHGTAKMFSAAKWVWNVENGETVTIKATVREHDDYNGEKTTLLVRPTRIDQ